MESKNCATLKLFSHRLFVKALAVFLGQDLPVLLELVPRRTTASMSTVSARADTVEQSRSEVMEGGQAPEEDVLAVQAPRVRVKPISRPRGSSCRSGDSPHPECSRARRGLFRNRTGPALRP